jgi:hypothetical protein
MRFMLIVKANKASEEGVLPDQKLMADMGKFNEEMIKAGILLSGDGLQSSAQGARVQFSKGKKTVIDGPFTEIKELIAGFWMINVKSKEEAIEWALRSPAPHGPGEEGQIEVRRVFELEDFGDNLSPEVRESEAKMRAHLAEKR